MLDVMCAQGRIRLVTKIGGEMATFYSYICTDSMVHVRGTPTVLPAGSSERPR